VYNSGLAIISATVLLTDHGIRATLVGCLGLHQNKNGPS
jgi:hypothetical protein